MLGGMLWIVALLRRSNDVNHRYLIYVGYENGISLESN